MRLKFTIFAIAFIVLTIPFTIAAQENAPENGCQPGANNQIVNGWQLFSQDEFVYYLIDFGYPEEAAKQRAEATYGFCDHNNDGYVCVMEQNLPNDATGSSKYWLAEDNHPFGG